MATRQSALREKMLQVREDAILAAVNRLLSQKGYDHMTVDEVAAEAGIAKAILYKHFASKEALAAAAMIRVLDQAIAESATLAADGDRSARGRLVALVQWAMRVQLAGEMPALPAQNSALRAALGAHALYLDRLSELSERLGEWITAAQAGGEIDPALPPELVLYTLFARACDPVLGLLKAGGSYDDDRIVELLTRTCFDGLAGAAPRAAAAPAGRRAVAPSRSRAHAG